MNFEIVVITIFFLSITNKVTSFNSSEYRLPKWALPVKYYLNIDLRDPDADIFGGSTWIDINVTEKHHHELVFNVEPNYIEIDDSTIVVNSNSSPCSNAIYNNKTQIMVLECSDDLYDDLKYTQFKMNYTAKFSTDRNGLYKHFYTINGTRKYMFHTNFQSVRFRRAFPSFDEPCFKAPISLRIDHNENLTVVSNTWEKEDSLLSKCSSSFEDTPPMSSYLLALAAGNSNDWEVLTVPNAYKFEIFHQKIFSDYLYIVKQNGPKLIDLIGNWTGIPYPDLGIPKMTFSLVPGMDGNMEDWGLIMFMERETVDEGDRTTSRQLRTIIKELSHEISHMWFGNYVTMNWWSEVWLHEGFASYFEWYLADMLNNYYNFAEMFVITELQVSFQNDGPTSSPLSRKDSDINTPNDILDTFSVRPYKKGGSIVRMLRYTLGEGVFQKGLRNYLKAKALGNSKATDVLEHLQAALNETGNPNKVDLSTYLNSWIYKSGYPVVRTRFNDLGNQSLISLDIYTFTNKFNPTGKLEDSIWWVPINYITSSQTNVSAAKYYWIKPERSFGLYIPKDNDSWCIINAGATGLYRVDYDQTTFKRILKVLNDPAMLALIPTGNRAQLLDDQFDIAKYYTEKMEEYNNRPYVKAFELAQYLKYETEYMPWYTFLREIHYIFNNIVDEKTKQVLRENVTLLIETRLVIPDGEDHKLTHSDILLKSLILEWACRLDHTDAITYVKTQFAKFLKDIQSVDSNYRDIIICQGIRKSKEQYKDYSLLKEAYAKSYIPFEKYEIALGMGCMTDSKSLQSLLESTLLEDPLIDKTHWKNMLANILESPKGVSVALQFLLNNYDKIIERWEIQGAGKISSLFSSVSSKLVKTEDIQMLQDYLLENPTTDESLVTRIKSAIATGQNNLRWIDTFGEELTSVIVYNGEDVPSSHYSK